MVKKQNNEEELDFEIQEIEDEASIRYDIATYPSDFTLNGIVEMWRNGDITIPEYQREFVWTIRQASLLIDSFLMGLPVPPVFFYIDDENRNLVIDGQQRILSTIFFFEGYFGFENIQGRRKVFRLHGLDAERPYSNKKFSELSESDQRKLKNTVLRAINIRQLAPLKDRSSVYHIFERLNTGGTPLKSQEIRNVVFRGPLVKMIRVLNNDKNWRKILGKKALDKHQRDVELILRIFALSYHLDSYTKPMKDFLNRTMNDNRAGTKANFKKFQKLFPRVCKKIIEELGEKPFHVRGPLNTSILDSVICTVLRNNKKLPDNLSNNFNEILSDPNFEEVTTVATTDENIVKKRFDLVQKHLLRK
ncbi:MAG: DUF262 domain-containing protein [Candidatus Omnitrophica bacterium]|nr:DUF262 domain-containing protein [Candidatus Omnitrophota bacterium]